MQQLVKKLSIMSLTCKVNTQIVQLIEKRNFRYSGFN